MHKCSIPSAQVEQIWHPVPELLPGLYWTHAACVFSFAMLHLLLSTHKPHDRRGLGHLLLTTFLISFAVLKGCIAKMSVCTRAEGGGALMVLLVYKHCQQLCEQLFKTFPDTYQLHVAFVPCGTFSILAVF